MSATGVVAFSGKTVVVDKVVLYLIVLVLFDLLLARKEIAVTATLIVDDHLKVDVNGPQEEMQLGASNKVQQVAPSAIAHLHSAFVLHPFLRKNKQTSQNQIM